MMPTTREDLWFGYMDCRQRLHSYEQEMDRLRAEIARLNTMLADAMDKLKGCEE